jgi:hypothetical protein
VKPSNPDLECPYCGAPLEANPNGEWQTCKRCRHRVNVAAQEAYHRGQAYFESIAGHVAESLENRPSKKFSARTEPAIPEVKPDTRQAYQQAYAALQIALQSTLPEAQRILSIEMMAKISYIFAKRAMIAPREFHFWTKLLLQAYQRREYREIQEALVEIRQSGSSIGSAIRRFELRLRRNQLARKLKSLSEEIDRLEAEMGFVSPPRVRGPEDEEDRSRR